MFQEKRIHKRVNVSVPINYETIENPLKRYGHTLSKDISENGIKIAMERFCPPKTKFLLRINLEEINKTIESLAETIWSFNIRASNRYHNGMRFIDMNQENKTALREYVTIKSLITQKGE